LEVKLAIIFQLSLGPEAHYIWEASPGNGIIDTFNHKSIIRIEVYRPGRLLSNDYSICRDDKDGRLWISPGLVCLYSDGSSVYIDGDIKEESSRGMPDPEFSLDEIHKAETLIK